MLHPLDLSSVPLPHRPCSVEVEVPVRPWDTEGHGAYPTFLCAENKEGRMGDSGGEERLGRTGGGRSRVEKCIRDHLKVGLPPTLG